MFELISQRYERASTLITSNIPFEEWTERFGTERLTGALLDRLTQKVNIHSRRRLNVSRNIHWLTRLLRWLGNATTRR